MMRVGIIGAGPNARSHVHDFQRSDRSHVVGSAAPELAESWAIAAMNASELLPSPYAQ
jgi:predicted dehydrogenase